MTSFTSDKFSWRIEQGDALSVLSDMPADSIDCVVTSPPYWGLRDYGVDGQLGLESHPQEYLQKLWEIFDEVKRVLKPTGCCFVNLGDTYAGSHCGAGDYREKTGLGAPPTQRYKGQGSAVANDGSEWLKPKNLLMIPARFAIGMQEGRPRPRIIKEHTDAAWLAGMVDADGCIGIRQGPVKLKRNRQFSGYIAVTQTDTIALQHIVDITGIGRVRPNGKPVGNRRQRYTWRVDGPRVADIVSDIYPWLFIKSRQAKLVSALQVAIDGFRPSKGQPLAADECEYRAKLWNMIKAANQRTLSDTLEDWPEPEQRRIGGGWWLRNDIVWHKPNAMPSSVKDRFSCSWEHMFFFTKAARYAFDLDAVREPSQIVFDAPQRGKRRIMKEALTDNTHPGYAERTNNPLGKNPGDCWIIPTCPFPEAHFAVYPPELIRKPIRAGCPPNVCVECGKPWERIVEQGELVDHPDRKDRKVAAVQFKDDHYEAGGTLGKMRERKTIGWRPTCARGMPNYECGGEAEPGIVLDPFSGAGTTGVVCIEECRNYIGIELSEEYCEMQRKRLEKATRQKQHALEL